MSQNRIYVGAELYDYLSDRVDRLDRRCDERITFRDAIIASLSDEERQRFEEHYAQTTTEKYGR